MSQSKERIKQDIIEFTKLVGQATIPCSGWADGKFQKAKNPQMHSN